MVGALWPETEGELLRLGGPQWVGTERNDDRGRGALAGDRGRTPAAQRPAVGGLGGRRRPPSPPSPTTSPTPASPPPRPHVTSTPYLVALEAVEEALMCTAVPPPSPPQPPKYVPKDPPTSPKPSVHGP